MALRAPRLLLNKLQVTGKEFPLLRVVSLTDRKWLARIRLLEALNYVQEKKCFSAVFFPSPCFVQVTVQYIQENGAVIPVRVHTIVISVQHDETVTLENMRKTLKDRVIKAVVPAKYLDERTIYHLQPSGRFVIGGPQV